MQTRMKLEYCAQFLFFGPAPQDAMAGLCVSSAKCAVRKLKLILTMAIRVSILKQYVPACLPVDVVNKDVCLRPRARPD